MSNQTTQEVPLWKEGRNGNIQFLASWKRLAKEQPDLYKLIEQREGFQCVDAEYEYHVGVSKWGLWLSRKAITTETLKAVANNEPTTTKKIGIVTGGNESKSVEINLFPTETPQKSHIDTDSLSFTPAEIKILKELAAAITELIKVRQ